MKSLSGLALAAVLAKVSVPLRGRGHEIKRLEFNDRQSAVSVPLRGRGHEIIKTLHLELKSLSGFRPLAGKRS